MPPAASPPPRTGNPRKDLALLYTQQEINDALDAICRTNDTGRGRSIRPEDITSIPTPKLMTPAQWIERGYPYMVYIKGDEG